MHNKTNLCYPGTYRVVINVASILIGLVLLVVSSGLIVLSQVTSSQTKLLEFSESIKNCDVVVEGTVEGAFHVIDPQKAITVADKENKQILSLPNPKEYLVGTIYKIKVSWGRTKGLKGFSNEFIHVLIPGKIALDGNVPSFGTSKKYLFFLKHLSSEDLAEFTTKEVVNKKSNDQFPSDVYILADSKEGSIEVKKENKQKIKKIIKAVKHVIES